MTVLVGENRPVHEGKPPPSERSFDTFLTMPGWGFRN